MGKLGNLIGSQAVKHLFANKQQGNQDKSHGDLPTPGVGKTNQEDKHKHDATGPHQPGMEKQEVEDARDQRRDQHHHQNTGIPIFLLNDRAEQENKCEVAHKMLEIGMPNHMRKEGQQGKRLSCRDLA